MSQSRQAIDVIILVMDQFIAITRAVSPSIGRCELTYLERQPIDVALAHRQHQGYTARLQDMGCQVVTLPTLADLPDSVFVDDTALVFDELAVITRPGAESRRPETDSIAAVLSQYRRLAWIEAPGTIDGGDVLRLGRRVYVGLSSRSNQAAIAQLQNILQPVGYSVVGVPLTGCLHLKSAATQVAVTTVLVNPDWVEASLFGDMTVVTVDPGEAHAANALWLGSGVIYPSAYPLTAQRLRAAGIEALTVDISELIKAEGAVTCCSLILRSQTP